MSRLQKPKLSRGSTSSSLYEDSMSTSGRLARPASTAGLLRVSSSAADGLSARGTSGVLPEMSTATSDNHSDLGSSKDHISVAVRVRPISSREVERGDRVVWGTTDNNQIGILHPGALPVRYEYDTVLDADCTNQQVYSCTSEPVVQSAMDGVNGCVFAYGVTSSGKTHTIMGDSSNPGVVPRALQDVFDIIEKTPGRDFLLRLSMMEIYNEVLNDLLDPARANLKLREDPKRGFYVEGIKEETLVSAEHALSVIATGVAHRKVSATTFNEGSSRSHTLLRLSIESSVRPDVDADPNLDLACTLSFLNIIDLAGSESAKAALDKGHRTEGSYINKSLLTLGTVIAKLSDGSAVHIPFRDSKLTRLLQSSLTGNGARISVICTITPASSQAEETHNTLKFATRAKKIEIKAQRNEIVDQASLIRRYQEEIHALRAQLDVVARERGGQFSIVTHDPLHPEVRNLRERLEEEHQALLTREQDKAALELRIARLTKLILHSTRMNTSTAAVRKQRMSLLRSFSEHMCPTPKSLRSLRKVNLDADSNSSDAESPHEGTFATALHHASLKVASWNETAHLDTDRPATPPSYDVGARHSPQQLEETLAGIRAAGTLFPGDGLVYQVGARQEAMYAPYDAEIDFLQDQISVLSDEIAERDKHIESLKSERIPAAYDPGAMTLRGSRASSLAPSDEADKDVELQILYAEREFMVAQVTHANANSAALATEIAGLKQQLASAQAACRLSPASVLDQPLEGPLQEALLSSSSSTFGSISNDIFADANRLAAELENDASLHTPSAEEVQNAAKLEAESSQDLQDKMQALQHQVDTALTELRSRSQQTIKDRRPVSQLKEQEAGVSEQLEAVTAETESIKEELSRLEDRNNQLQGYGLDNMSAEELSGLIHGLTQAVERVRITVQLRRLANSSSRPEYQLPPTSSRPTHVSPDLSRHSPSGSLRSTSSMSLESMRSVMSNLRSKHRPSVSNSVSDGDNTA